MQTKAETRQHLMSFITFIETQFSKKIKTIRSDNGQEFLMHSFFQSKGILHQLTCVETPQQNGIAERKQQHILNVARALMFQANLPIQFWSHAITHAVHIINILPCTKLHNTSPYSVLYDTTPDLSTLKVFGSLYYASTISAHRTKFQPRARKCIYLGHKDCTKGFLLFDLNNREIFLSRHVVFYETVFPFPRSVTKQPLDTLLCLPIDAPSPDMNHSCPSPPPCDLPQPSSESNQSVKYN